LATDPRNECIAILAPTGRDAELASAALRSAKLTAEAVPDIDGLCRVIAEGCGAVLITEEALNAAAMKCLREELEKQPAWSDLPLLIFTSRPSAELAVRSFEQLGARANVTMIERPIRVKTMISAAYAAMRARRRQYEVRDLVEELEQRVKERDHFLAMLSHELRNPLAAISLAVDSIGGATEISDEHAILVRQTRHLAKLVDDLLDIARVTTGKISLHLTAVDVADVAEHCVEALRPRADARRLRLTLHTSPHAIVRGDPVRLEQVVNNLVSNAIKYTPPGGEIDVAVEKTEADEVVLRVSDNGQGIAPEMLTRIFDLFMQGDTTLDRTEGGMGVGLTLVKRLVDLHRGTVRAHSRGRGSGSEFVVRLPLAATHAAAAARPKGTPAEPAVSRRILVIEDNSDIRELLRLKLRQLGHKVEAAEDGTRGLEQLLASPPEVALIDIGLPGINGYEIARRARATLGSKVYLVALTGYGQSEDKEKALAAGFDVHLTKPADFADLQNVLTQVPLSA
jgi:signal transduction histidine kinase/CheY-like chemotaxis protein